MSQSELPQPPQSPAHQPLLDPPRTPRRLVTSDPMAEHPSPPSSSGSNKRIADSEISELVRRAKASRYSNPPPRQSDDDIADTLERDLSCAICSEVLTNPVACLDCLHNFCVPWFERSDTCPTCRRVVKGTHDNHATASLIETLLNIFPDRKRDADELKELELIYRPGQKINITNTYSDEDEEQEQEDEDEDDGITWTPCPCCVSPNPHNFICPDPIPSPDPARGPVRSDVYSYRSHIRCQVCPNIFPTAWKAGWKCENCNSVNCGNLFQCSVEGVLRPLKDQAAKLADTYMEGLVTSYFAGLLVPANYINTTEFALFSAWKVTNNVTWRDIGVKICDFLLEKNGGVIPFLPKQLRPEDFTCYPCMLPVLKCNFVSWWIHERESTGYVDNRVKCWYGKGCRTQAHNPEHAARLIHACDETPAGRRRNDAPRGGGMAVGVGAPGEGAFGGGVMVAAVAAAGVGGVEADDGGNGGGGDGDAGGGAADGGGGGGGGGE